MFAVLVGGEAGDFFEHAAQVVRVLEPDLVGDFADRLVGAEEQVFHFVDDHEVDVFDGGLACLFFHEVAEVVGGEVQFLRAPVHRGQSDLLRLVRVEIVNHQVFEAGQHVFVDELAGDELAVVEAQAVVEQDFDVGGDDGAGVLVDVVPSSL